jgi:hypothetical protein
MNKTNSRSSPPSGLPSEELEAPSEIPRKENASFPDSSPEDDPDAPLDIPWKKVILFLVLAWAFFRFSWLIFEIAG